MRVAEAQIVNVAAIIIGYQAPLHKDVHSVRHVSHLARGHIGSLFRLMERVVHWIFRIVRRSLDLIKIFKAETQ